MKTSIYMNKPYQKYLLSFCLILASVQAAYAWRITEIISPFPPHCVSENQWLDPVQFNPMNLFDGQKSVWDICAIAVKAPGYTVDFKLEAPLQIDELRISLDPKAKRKITKIDVLFYLNDLSAKYPYALQEVDLYENQEKIIFKDMLAWNTRLKKMDRNFDQKRIDLGLDEKGITPPIRFDKIGIVVREMSEGQGAVGIEELQFLLKGKTLVLENEKDIRSQHAEFIGKAYRYILENNVLIGDQAKWVFSDQGAIWYQGELTEAIAKILKISGKKKTEWQADQPAKIGHWRFEKQHIEISDLSKKKFTPLTLWVDEAPRKMQIEHPLYGGTYQVKTPVVTEEVDQDTEVQADEKTAQKPTEKAPSFITE
jgi:hypothetical protein